LEKDCVSVWLTFPSKKPAFEAEKCLAAWRERGYKLAIWRDTGDEPVNADLLLRGIYPGYYAAVNRLCKAVLEVDPDAAWVIAAGDDMLPDHHPPEQIAEECTEHFGGTFGVMQPTGDRWGDPGHVYAEHICGSPWLGREFCRRMYGGRGPYSEEFFHMWGDEALMNVAVRLGVLWQRIDLIHYHAHWARENKPMPVYLQRANAEFYAGKEIFERQKAAGFPGHEPIP
jgi:hypothetical protein